MKTKYIKVKTSERFPKEAGQYSTEIGDVLFSSSLSQFLNYDGDVMHIEWFLEEIPDREDEMRLLLKESKEKLMDIDWAKYPKCQNTYEKIDSLLQELEKM